MDRDWSFASSARGATVREPQPAAGVGQAEPGGPADAETANRGRQGHTSDRQEVFAQRSPGRYPAFARGTRSREARHQRSRRRRPVRSPDIRTDGSRRHHSIRRHTMNNQTQTTLHDRDGPNTYRKTATTIGVIYLLGFVTAIGGNILIQSLLGASDPLAAVGTSSMLIAIGAMLWLLPAAGDAAHGILMFPIMKRYGERIAYGYFGARIMDAVFVGVMALLILFQLPLASEYVKAGASDTSYLQ